MAPAPIEVHVPDSATAPTPATWWFWATCTSSAGSARPSLATPYPCHLTRPHANVRITFRALVADLSVHFVRFRGLSRILTLLGCGVDATTLRRDVQTIAPDPPVALPPWVEVDEA